MDSTVVRNIGASMLHSAGITPLCRRVNSRNVPILMYHGVVPDHDDLPPPGMLKESKFRWQMDYMARHYEVVPLRTIVACLSTGSALPRCAAVITFDDGYRNNYTVAYPIVKNLGLPATIFLVTGYIDTNHRLWPDVLYQTIIQTGSRLLDLSDLDDDIYQLDTAAQRRSTFLLLVERLKRLPAERKNSCLDTIVRRLAVDLDRSADSDNALFALLRRHEILEMHRDGLVSFGAHTDAHEILTRLPTEEARRQIAVSKQKIESLLGEQGIFFAYPNGTPHDFSENLKSEIRDCGFLCALASGGGLVKAQSDRYELPRLHVGTEQNHAYFQLKVAGAIESLSHLQARQGGGRE